MNVFPVISVRVFLTNGGAIGVGISKNLDVPKSREWSQGLD